MISTRGRYAVRILVDLAECDMEPDRVVPLREIARRQGVSEKYLQRIARRLVEAGILVGASGKGGGYRLARPANEMRVLEVLEATEGTLAPVACLAPESLSCERADQCKTLVLWERFYTMVCAFFESVTVEDLVTGSFGREL